MKREHLRTLEAIYAHPLQHGLRLARVEALLRELGAEVQEMPDQRLRIRLPSGQETWIRGGPGPHRADLDAEALLRLRQFLRDADISPDHPVAGERSPRGDQSRRLVLCLSHRATDVFRLEGDAIQHEVLRSHGLWGSDQNLTHRHERDQAGQKAPVDQDYLHRLCGLIAEADAVLLLGHGHGDSDLRQLLLHHLANHRRDLLPRIVGNETVDASALGEAGLVAIARRFFGNLPHRHLCVIPGQELPSA